MYEVKFVPSSQAAALAGVMRRIRAAGKLGAQVILPNGDLSDGSRSTIATHKRPATRNGVFHGATARTWEVLDSDGKTVLGSFEVPVDQCAAVIGASYIRQYRVPVGTDTGEIDDLANELFGDSFDDLPDAPEINTQDNTDNE